MSNHTIFEYNMETRTIELKTEVSNCLFNSPVITPELVHENGCPTSPKMNSLKFCGYCFVQEMNKSRRQIVRNVDSQSKTFGVY